MNTDPIADFLTRIRNGLLARHAQVRCPSSKMKKKIAEILTENGFISGYSVEPGTKADQLVLTLKYVDGTPVIDGLKRHSRPGIRIYRRASELPKIRNGLGVALVSTSHGVMTDQSAREQSLGGEVLCSVW